MRDDDIRRIEDATEAQFRAWQQRQWDLQKEAKKDGDMRGRDAILNRMQDARELREHKARMESSGCLVVLVALASGVVVIARAVIGI